MYWSRFFLGGEAKQDEYELKRTGTINLRVRCVPSGHKDVLCET